MIHPELKTSEVLDLAADKIEERGWRTGGGWWPSKERPGLCLEGGLIAALGIAPEELDLDDEDQWNAFKTCPAYQAVRDYIGTPRALWSWNDHGQTQESVLEVLRGAAEAERQKEQA